MQALHNLPPLRLREMRDGVVIPAVGNCTAGLTHGGVVNAQGQIDPGSLLYRRSMRVVFPPETLPEAADTVEEPHIYAGFFIWHYGHFLLESLARLWATTRYPDMHIVWAGSEAPTRWQREICDMFGIGDRMRFVDRPTRFRRLIMPEPGIRLGDYAHPDHIRFLGIHARPKAARQARGCGFPGVCLMASGAWRARTYWRMRLRNEVGARSRPRHSPSGSNST